MPKEKARGKANDTVVIALLRGVNVLGRNIVKMEELRRLCGRLGLRDPRTLLQSGNIVFGTKERDLTVLGLKLEAAIEKKCGCKPIVVLRTAEEIRSTVKRDPFAGRDGIDPSKYLITFLAVEPTPAARAKGLAVKTGPEELVFDGGEAFIYFPNGIGRAEMSWPAVERALGTRGTGRNWNTVKKLAALAAEVEASA